MRRVMFIEHFHVRRDKLRPERHVLAHAAPTELGAYFWHRAIKMSRLRRCAPFSI